MKLLEEILETVKFKSSQSIVGMKVSDVSTDSRKARKNSLFIAYKGLVQDGHEYIDSAIENGAGYVVLDNEEFIQNDRAVFIKVDDARQVAGVIAANFFDNPSRKMTLVGITGTNGKTTTVKLLYDLFTRLGYNSGLISTIENRYADRVIPAQLTTPDPVSLQALFADMLDKQTEMVFMEASSHALHQGRLNACDFDLAIFSNITHDHLDYHGSFAEYIKAKKLLFDRLKKSATALINIDDVNARVMVQNSGANIREYALNRPAEFKGRIISNDVNGLQMEINKQEVYLRLIGKFNAYNALAVYGTAVLMGEDKTDVLIALSSLSSAEGRLEILDSGKSEFKAVVDYAHTPDALQKVLTALNELKERNGRIICVIGCGGNRDKTKRPIMAEKALDQSDVCIFTSDNPRNEDPESILDDMMSQLDDIQMEKALRIQDRRQAIKMAVMMATQGDIILVAGKGHEKYQEIKGQRFPFDDKEILNAYMRREDI